jgi:hypothetical protein
MSLQDVLEKIAGDSGSIDTTEKIASYYDGLGRELFWGMFNNGVDVLNKEAAAGRRLPPGAFSGKKGILKLLGLGGLGAGGYAVGAARERKKATEDDVALANRAYRAGVQRGAQAVLARMRGMGG